MTEQEEQPRTLLRLLYLGRRKSDKKKTYAWYPVAADIDVHQPLKYEAAEEKQYLGTNIFPSAAPGVIIEVEAKDRSVYPSTAKVVGRWQNAADVQRWQIASRAVAMEADLRAKTLQDLREEVRKLIEPLQKIYAKASLNRRPLVLSLVLSEIMRMPSSSVTEKWRREEDEE